MPDKPNPRDAVLAALALARGGLAPTNTPGVLPSARSRLAVARLVDAGSIEALTASQPDMRGLLSDLLDWNGAKATKTTVRAAGGALTALSESGRSRYPQAVEMLSFAASIAPLLEPDRLARVIAAAASAQSAYAPIRYPATVAAGLKRVVGHYQQARLEPLLISLWAVAHAGRWWDVCGGLGKPGRRRRRRRNPDEAPPARGAEVGVQSAAIARAYSGDDADVLQELIEGDLVYTPPTLARLAQVRLADSVYPVIASFATGLHDDPDHSILVAQLADLAPGDRPESPIPVLVESLEFMLGEESPTEVLPKKPMSWDELYPKASMANYPFPENVLALDWMTLPGTGEGTRHKPAVIEWCRNPHALFQNREYMGNCTGGYDGRCKAGTCFIGKIHFDGEVYNFSIDRRGPGWVVSQVNSRYNHGNVPGVIHTALNQVVGTLGAAA